MKHALMVLQRPVIILIFCLSIVCLNLSAQKIVIKGTISGINDLPIKVWFTKGGENKEMIIQPKNDQFEFASDDSTMTVYVNGSRTFKFWFDSPTIELSGNIDFPHQLTIIGGQENRIVNEFNTTNNWVCEPLLNNRNENERKQIGIERRLKTLDFIYSNLDSKTSIWLLFQMLNDDEHEVDHIVSVWNKIYPTVKASSNGKEFLKSLNESGINQY